MRSKFTAVGRKEILTFFYLYVLLTAVSLVLDAGVLGSSNEGAFLYFVAVQNGLASALCTSLLVNGFVGFQLYEDGTMLSVWLLRLSSAAMFAISFMVSLLTFKGWGGLGPTSTTGLFVVLFVINAICVAVYLVMQVILVVNTLQDRWPLWDLAAAVFFFVVGQVILYSFGSKICRAVNHYLDGLFFATVCNLLTVMMIYKVRFTLEIPPTTKSMGSVLTREQYWDSITKEDLEFSVGTKQGNWDLASKDPLLDQYSDIGPGHAGSRGNSLYGVPTGRDSMYDTSSLDYRPVSHGDTMSRNYPQSTAYTGSGAGAGTERESRKDRSSQGYAPQNANMAMLTQHANNSGSLSLLDRRQSYGTPGADNRENRKSMQVHVGMADENDAQSYGYEPPRYAGGHQRGQSGERRRESRRRESDRERERDREYAY